MEAPFAKSISLSERYERLRQIVGPEDSLAVLISADPDAMASALALKRIFWRRVKRIKIIRINKIQRADNLAFIKLLNIDQQHIRSLKSSEITKWALVDSQPSHDEQFSKHSYDIIIDHHPVSSGLNAAFIDIREDYGANSTILTEYLKAAKIKPSPRLATALFYGIKSDTNNFVRQTVSNDIIAFRYLYEFANLNVVKKIESSEMTKKTLSSFKTAMENMSLIKHTAFIHMGNVANADTLVMVADFFMKMAEVTWSIVSGLENKKLIVILRNTGFRRDAGKLAQKMFGDFGSAGGHKNMARAEIPISQITPAPKKDSDYRQFVLDKIKKKAKNLD
jgi:nanoRNase/pAp phosphatase (c-di-AMP/oligoRNAs hydrolase)